MREWRVTTPAIMQPIGINPPAIVTLRRPPAFVVFSRRFLLLACPGSKGEPGQRDRKTERGRLSKWTFEQSKKGCTEKKKREWIVSPKLAQRKTTDVKRNRTPPEQKGPAKNWPAFQDNSRPLVFCEEKFHVSDKKIRA